ncbi:MAG: DUF3800 domain-containing protein [Candidatus Gastranaerophilales bacterium]|nr:DUF3800 domain-containing protein [Candidatus Gastranaerophilales bacterium]
MFLFYIDDSGQIDYNPNASEYFVYNALGFNSHDWNKINQQVVELKQNIFKTPNAELLELKSNWIRIPKEREKRWYLKKLSETELKQLTDRLLDIIIQNNIILIAVVINKNNMLKKYGQNAYPPNIYAMELLLERISLFMHRKYKDKQAIIIADRCSNNIEDLLNKNHVEHRGKLGGYTWKNLSIVIENLLFVDSKYSNFIQLTDICAYNVFRAFKDRNPNYEFFQRILSKYDRDEKECLLNYGIVCKPLDANKDIASGMINFLKKPIK